MPLTYDNPELEIARLRRFYYENFNNMFHWRRPRRTPHHLTLDGTNMQCLVCEKRRLQSNPFENLNSNRWCMLCHRFKVSAPALRESRLCSCPCDCDSDPNLEPNDEDAMLSDSDYSPDSPDSTGSSTSSESSGLEDSQPNPNPHIDLATEVQDLTMGLTAWEVYALEHLGHPQGLLRRQFPEMIEIHGRDDHPPNSPRPLRDCGICRKQRMPEVEEAIMRGLVILCESCDRPKVRGERNTTDASVLDLHACLCHCSCPTQSSAPSAASIWMPFRANTITVTPSPAIQRILQLRGFCARDVAAEQLRDAEVNGVAMPSYSEIITNTIPDYLQSNTFERFRDAGFELAGGRVQGGSFPNGVRRASNTDSGLPIDIEMEFRLMDPNAFGHLTRARYDQRPNSAQAASLSEEELSRWDRVLYMQQRRSILEYSTFQTGADLALWAAQYGHDFELEDDDGDSVCSIDVLGEQDYEEMYREACMCSRPCRDRDCFEYRGLCRHSTTCGRPQCFEEAHQARHRRRRLERVAYRGSFPYRETELDFALTLQREYEARRDNFSQSDVEDILDHLYIEHRELLRENDRYLVNILSRILVDYRAARIPGRRWESPDFDYLGQTLVTRVAEESVRAAEIIGEIPRLLEELLNEEPELRRYNHTYLVRTLDRCLHEYLTALRIAGEGLRVPGFEWLRWRLMTTAANEAGTQGDNPTLATEPRAPRAPQGPQVGFLTLRQPRPQAQTPIEEVAAINDRMAALINGTTTPGSEINPTEVYGGDASYFSDSTSYGNPESEEEASDVAPASREILNFLYAVPGRWTNLESGRLDVIEDMTEDLLQFLDDQRLLGEFTRARVAQLRREWTAYVRHYVTSATTPPRPAEP